MPDSFCQVPDNRLQEDVGGLYVTDAEIIRRLNIPRKVGYRAIQELDVSKPGRPVFPQKDPLFGNRRFWPAVEKYFRIRHGLEERPFMAAPRWQEKPNATAETGKAGRNRDAGTSMETSKETLDRLVASASGHRPKQVPHQKPTLVAAVEPAGRHTDD